MGLNLDARQRAMLQEMGVRVWWPRAGTPGTDAPQDRSPTQASERAAVVVAPVAASTPTPTPTPTPAAAPATAPAAAAAAAPAPTRVAAPAPVAAAEGGPIEDMDWAQLAQAVQACTACGLCEGRKAPVFIRVPEPAQADWLVVGEPPDEQEERAGAPFVGEAGQLLDNMLRAVQCRRDGQGRGGARLTHVVKCRPAAVRPPQADELARCAVFLRRELALTRPRVVLAMGRFAALSLLGEAYPEVLQMPLGQLRGRVFRVDGLPVIVTYPPVKLLRAPMEKANVWADLCLARSLVDGGA